MEIHEIDDFADDLAQIEEFCVYIAANQRLLNAYGVKRALRYEHSESVVSLMKEFPENFASARRLINVLDKHAAAEIEEIERSSTLVEQVGLIALQLRMAITRSRSDEVSVSMFEIIAALPYVGRLYSGNMLISNSQISIQKLIIGLQRLRGSLIAFHSHFNRRNFGDNELFKPSKISPDRVISLIDTAAVSVENSITISIEQKQIISNYLSEAKAEVASKYPSWPKIVGALMIVAALTSGIADAKGAANNIQEAIRYIIDLSATNPLLGTDRLRLDYDASEQPPEYVA